METGDVRDNNQGPATKEQEILLHIAKSSRLGIGDDGRIQRLDEHPSAKELWYGCAIEDGYDGIFGRLFLEKPTGLELDQCIREVLNIPPSEDGRDVVVVISPGSLQRFRSIGDSIEDIGKRVFVWGKRSGLANRSEARWLDECICDVILELSLLHEKPPTVAETRLWAKDDKLLWEISPADHKGEYCGKRREVLSGHAETIMISRGRHISIQPENFPPDISEARISQDFERATKEIKKLKKYSEYGELTEIGELLHEIALESEQWKNNPSLLDEVLQALGENLLRGAINTYSGRNRSTWPYQVRLVAPIGSIDSELIERAVFSRLRKGIPIAWLPDSWQWRFSSDSEETTAGIATGFWVPLKVTPVAKDGILSSIPRHPTTSQHLTKALGISGVRIHVSPHLIPESRFRSLRPTTRRTTLPEWPTATQSLLEAMTMNESSALQKKHWFSYVEKDETRLTLIIATFPTESSPMEQISLLSELPKFLMNELNSVIKESGFGRPVLSTGDIEFYDAPYINNDQRLRLLMGG
ncbi:hypothetical protein [Ralstonia pseudosolanacearum]|uniref:hypothetical protein n=1 Tax=Ralstonia pseudosolanacearum TaxID=1310165 RepID=UPI003CF39EFC